MPIEITAKFNGGLRFAPIKDNYMKIELDYFNEEFSIKDADLSNVKPFSHADVIVNCDQPLSRTHGPLEKEVAEYLSNALECDAKWDQASEWAQPQQMGKHEFPRISKLKMGINIDL